VQLVNLIREERASGVAELSLMSGLVSVEVKRGLSSDIMGDCSIFLSRVIFASSAKHIFSI
jgi:hypothetical protein